MQAPNKASRPQAQDVLRQVVDTAAGAEDLEALARPMLELLEAVTGLESTYLTLIDEAANQQRILFSRNSRKLQIPEGLTVPWGDTLCKRALEEGRAYTDDVAAWGDSQAARDLGIQTYLSQPVRMLDGTVFGTLCAASGERVRLEPETVGVLARFARLIAQQVERERALQEAQRANAELRTHAVADPLTGLANRRGMEQALERMLDELPRSGEGLQAAFVDLDGFKAINDQYGHEIGDRFLVHIARRLTAAVRPQDVVARTGGDEFVVLAPGAADAALRERLEQATVGRFAVGGYVLDYVGASVGVAHAVAGDHDVAELLRRADAAMYEAKRARVAARPRGG